jgi:hypothetical protein
MSRKKTDKLIKKANYMIKQLSQQLKECLDTKTPPIRNIRHIPVNTPKSKYTGVGSLQTKCMACQRRRFG